MASRLHNSEHAPICPFCDREQKTLTERLVARAARQGSGVQLWSKTRCADCGRVFDIATSVEVTFISTTDGAPTVPGVDASWGAA